MSAPSEALYGLLRIIEAKPEQEHRPTWAELCEVIREAADWQALGEYDEYMGEDL